MEEKIIKRMEETTGYKYVEDASSIPADTQEKVFFISREGNIVTVKFPSGVSYEYIHDTINIDKETVAVRQSDIATKKDNNILGDMERDTQIFKDSYKIITGKKFTIKMIETLSDNREQLNAAFGTDDITFESNCFVVRKGSKVVNEPYTSLASLLFKR